MQFQIVVALKHVFNALKFQGLIFAQLAYLIIRLIIFSNVARIIAKNAFKQIRMIISAINVNYL